MQSRRFILAIRPAHRPTLYSSNASPLRPRNGPCANSARHFARKNRGKRDAMRKASFCSIQFLAIALMTTLMLAIAPNSVSAHVHLGVFVSFAPPELPLYVQPVCPAEGYLWTPGYWAWDPEVADYYWVPGTWVLPPEPGLLWTPGYWGWGPDGYFFSAGYWGPAVGFYGGIDYGFGYFGHGYNGGRWDHDHFFYNRDVTNLNVTIVHNVYDERVNNEFRSVSRVSFNGGRGGVIARPTPREQSAVSMHHFGPDAAQTRHRSDARANRELRASVNHGPPPIAATSRPGEFRGSGVTRARETGAVYTPPARRRHDTTERQSFAIRRENNAHPSQNSLGRQQYHPARVNPQNRGRYVPAARRPEAPSRANPRVNNRDQQDRSQQRARQESDRQSIQRRQNRDRQPMIRQRVGDPERLQMTPRSQQQPRQFKQRQARQVPADQRPSSQRPEARPHGRPH